MSRVIKLDAKTPERRKSLQHSRLRVCMTNGADRTRRIRKLFRVATGAWQMSTTTGQRGFGRIALTPVAKQTGKSSMVRVVVAKL